MDYRAYFIGQDGHFQHFEVIEAPGDAAAVEAAAAFTDGQAVEVWDLDRKVAVLPAR